MTLSIKVTEDLTFGKTLLEIFVGVIFTFLVGHLWQMSLFAARKYSSIGSQPALVSMVKGYVSDIGFSNDSSYLVCGVNRHHSAPRGVVTYFDSEILLFKVNSAGCSPLWRQELQQSPVISVAISSSFVASSHVDKKVTFRNRKTGRIISRIRIAQSTINDIAFSPDGRYMACARDDGVVTIWDVRTSRVSRSVRISQLALNSVAYSMDGTVLGIAAEDGSIRIVSPIRGTSSKLVKYVNPVTAVGFGNSGILVCGTSDGVIGLWDTKTRTKLFEQKVEDDVLTVETVAVTGGAQMIVVGYVIKGPKHFEMGKRDVERIAIWPAHSKAPSITLRGKGSYVSLSQKRNMVASGGEDGKMWIWRLKE